MTTPPLEPDDPRLTAYALGELDDPAERAAVEHLLDASPAARAEVEHTRTLAQVLAAEYAEEQAAYQAIRAQAGSAPNVIPFPAPAHRAGRRWTKIALKIAAVFLVFAGLALGTARWREKRPDLAATTPPAVPPTVTTASAPQPSVTATPTDALFATRSAPRKDEDGAPSGGAPVPTAAEEETPLLAMAQPPTVVPTAPALAPSTTSADDTLLAESSPAAAPGGAADRRAAVRRAATPVPALKVAVPTPDPAETERRIAASLVRIRRQDGLSADGVVIAAGGLVLTPDFLPSGQEQGTYQAVDREGTFRATFLRRLGSGHACLFEVDAHGLTAIPLADFSRPQTGPLILAGIKGETESVVFVRVPARPQFVQADHGPALETATPIGQDATFRLAFNAAGEFLSAEPLHPAERGRNSEREQQRFLFRLLTPEDRAALATLIKAHSH